MSHIVQESSDTTQLYGRDLRPGLSFRGSERKISQRDFEAFAELTGDSHPIHYDESYAATTRFARPLAHGLLLVGLCALGATAFSRRLEDSMIAFTEQSSRFKHPVFVGDTVIPHFVVTTIEADIDRGQARVRFDVTLTKNEDLVCLEAGHEYLLLWSPPEGTDRS